MRHGKDGGRGEQAGEQEDGRGADIQRRAGKENDVENGGVADIQRRPGRETDVEKW